MTGPVLLTLGFVVSIPTPCGFGAIARNERFDVKKKRFSLIGEPFTDIRVNFVPPN